ncbi:glycine cleavage system protein H [Paenibacillus sp. LMG 31460]|uniref:Glycine cleavage system protein H n=1 Tax=Paenibacillus germinis TaxID=2654979 RepID=A0ABX1ZD20_9BACL|nr:glycine cleavage system protein H [Paenibacillus germinis]NOU90141.1 glycine cleavage system protein H [Paenibacillus germinis]
MTVPTNLKYTRDHYWIRLDGEKAVVGLTEYGISELGMIVFIELPDQDTHVSKGEFIGSVETAADDENDLLAPLSGKITSVNRLLERAVMLIHESPYDKGWLFTIQWSQESELEQLWEEETYDREFSLED